MQQLGLVHGAPGVIEEKLILAKSGSCFDRLGMNGKFDVSHRVNRCRRANDVFFNWNSSEFGTEEVQFWLDKYKIFERGKMSASL